LFIANRKIEGNYIITTRLGSNVPGIFVQFNKDNKANVAENYEVNFALDTSDQFGKPDPKSNEQAVDVDVDVDVDEQMRVDFENLDPNNKYEVKFTIDKFIEYCQDIVNVEREYYANILKNNFGPTGLTVQVDRMYIHKLFLENGKLI